MKREENMKEEEEHTLASTRMMREKREQGYCCSWEQDYKALRSFPPF